MAEKFEKCCKFKIELKGTKATRTVIFPADITLFMLHQIIQQIFGWRECHLWHFRDAKRNFYGFGEDPFGQPIDCGVDYVKTPDEVRLDSILKIKGDKMVYEYDFGDGWEHVITRMGDVEERSFECLKTTGPDGEEDCGGCWGLNALKRPPADLDDINNRMEFLVLTIKETSKSMSYLDEYNKKKSEKKVKKTAQKKGRKTPKKSVHCEE